MRIHWFVKSVLLLPSLWVVPLVFSVPLTAAAQQEAGGTGVVQAGETALSKESSPLRATGMASDAAEDTLKACLGRIPSQATAGQRMLAEQSCQGQHETRASSHASPQF